MIKVELSVSRSRAQVCNGQLLRHWWKKYNGVVGLSLSSLGLEHMRHLHFLLLLSEGGWMGTQEKGFCLQPDLVSCIFSVLYLLSVVRLVIGCWCWLTVVSVRASVVIFVVGVDCRVLTVNCQVSLSVVLVGSLLSAVGFRVLVVDSPCRLSLSFSIRRCPPLSICNKKNNRSYLSLYFSPILYLTKIIKNLLLLFVPVSSPPLSCSVSSLVAPGNLAPAPPKYYRSKSKPKCGARGQIWRNNNPSMMVGRGGGVGGGRWRDGRGWENPLAGS